MNNLLSAKILLALLIAVQVDVFTNEVDVTEQFEGYQSQQKLEHNSTTVVF